MVDDEPTPVPERRELAVLMNEFAVVRLSLDHAGNGPRLLVEDAETGDSIFLEPLELASLCLATAEDRLQWLKVGAYRDERSTSERPS
ncbi:hypothetical protein [Nocardioides sp. Iso805N]|uniref:hypothetical protein n=1 Tax=Nocardioides sp. Iso805N TaxID=1283287 RepID=UPI00036B021F|nr:hypothetical protein [Nocardioides sp. Iso805N]